MSDYPARGGRFFFVDGLAGAGEEGRSAVMSSRGTNIVIYGVKKDYVEIFIPV
jgi:hypothetical protein